MNKCKACNISFKKGVKKIGCGFCGKWFHAEECTKISEDMWNLLSREKQLHWYCEECNSVAPEVLQIVQKCVKDNIEMKKELNELKRELKDIKEGTHAEIVETMRRIAAEVYEERETEHTETIKNIATEVYEERETEENGVPGCMEENL